MLARTIQVGIDFALYLLSFAYSEKHYRRFNVAQATYDLRAKQQTSLTPRLQQSVKLLQMSALEFTQEVQQALSNNPFLDDGDDIEDHGDNEDDESENDDDDGDKDDDKYDD